MLNSEVFIHSPLSDTQAVQAITSKNQACMNVIVMIMFSLYFKSQTFNEKVYSMVDLYRDVK
jgi:hypothetical protein